MVVLKKGIDGHSFILSLIHSFFEMLFESAISIENTFTIEITYTWTVDYNNYCNSAWQASRMTISKLASDAAKNHTAKNHRPRWTIT